MSASRRPTGTTREPCSTSPTTVGRPCGSRAVVTTPGRLMEEHVREVLRDQVPPVEVDDVALVHECVQLAAHAVDAHAPGLDQLVGPAPRGDPGSRDVGVQPHLRNCRFASKDVQIAVVTGSRDVFFDDLEAIVREPLQDAIPRGVVVIAAPTPGLAVHGRQSRGGRLVELPVDLRRVDLLDGQVDETAAAHGPMQVGEHSRPVVGRDELQRIDAHDGVEHAIELELLEAHLFEHDFWMLCVRLGQHAGRLIDPHHRSAQPRESSRSSYRCHTEHRGSPRRAGTTRSPARQNADGSE